MNMRRLAIRGYRSISKADLALGQITVIIGASDSGKSNVVRALRDWAFNASGTSFATQGQKVTRVAVVVGHDHKVVFEKNAKGKKSVSRYVTVDAETGEKQVFEKIGLSVPQQVVDMTGIREVVVDDLKVRIHFSEQADPWFLLAPSAWTASKVSRIIGRISGVDALLLANRDLVNKRSAISREAKTLRGAGRG